MRKAVLAATRRGNDFGITGIHSGYFAGLLEQGQDGSEHFLFARVDEEKRLVRLDSFADLLDAREADRKIDFIPARARPAPRKSAARPIVPASIRLICRPRGAGRGRMIGAA